MRRINHRELKVGDTLIFLGVPHLITEIEPYEHPTVPGFFGMARDATGWSISLNDGPGYLEIA